MTQRAVVDILDLPLEDVVAARAAHDEAPLRVHCNEATAGSARVVGGSRVEAGQVLFGELVRRVRRRGGRRVRYVGQRKGAQARYRLAHTHTSTHTHTTATPDAGPGADSS